MSDEISKSQLVLQFVNDILAIEGKASTPALAERLNKQLVDREEYLELIREVSIAVSLQDKH